MYCLQKLKESKFFRRVIAVFVSGAMMSLFSLSAFAAEESGATAGSADMTSVLSDSLNSMLTNLIGYVGVALPIALSVVGAFFGIKKAIAFFKSVSNKG